MKKSVEETLSQLDNQLPPDGQKFVSRSMNIQVDLPAESLAQQKLHVVRPFEHLADAIPGSLSSEAQIVMRALFDCFDRQGQVKEGLLDDLLWGFEQCGIPPMLTYEGLRVLERSGFIEFTTLEHMPVLDLKMVKSPKFVWVKYRRKLLDMVYSK